MRDIEVVLLTDGESKQLVAADDSPGTSRARRVSDST